MLGEPGFLESAMVTYWISRNPTQLHEAKIEFEKSHILDLGKKLLEIPEEIDE
jgi:hypothetical protein